MLYEKLNEYVKIDNKNNPQQEESEVVDGVSSF